MNHKTRVCLLMAVLAIATPFLIVGAFADDAKPTPTPPKFAPIVLSQEDAKNLTDYIGALPYNQAAPIMQFLMQKEADAQRAAQSTKKP